MRFTHPLTELFGTAARVDILRILSQTEQPLSGRQVAQRAGLAPAAALATLRGLHELGVLGLLRRGRAHGYWLDRWHALVRTVVLPAFAAEAALRQRALEACLAHLHGYRAAVLFGSVAHGREKWRSDIDLLFVVDDEGGRACLERQLDDIALEVLRDYGNALSPVVVTAEELRSALAQRQPFLCQILQEGTVLADRQGNLISIAGELAAAIAPAQWYAP
ncbi:MAG: nucleotidyltransferase domain-containing protein [Chloroflexi bacterium]|nr:nucleotidyltransferase domain-containing protein [Chloroflexota bacterium]